MVAVFNPQEICPAKCQQELFLFVLSSVFLKASLVPDFNISLRADSFDLEEGKTSHFSHMRSTTWLD